jgi:hypothetical protein
MVEFREWFWKEVLSVLGFILHLKIRGLGDIICICECEVKLIHLKTFLANANEQIFCTLSHLRLMNLLSLGQSDFDAALMFDACSVSLRQFSLRQLLNLPLLR